MSNFKRWLKQGTMVGSGKYRFKVTNAFWLFIASAIILMLLQELWMWAIILGVIAAVVGMAVTKSKRGT